MGDVRLGSEAEGFGFHCHMHLHVSNRSAKARTLVSLLVAEVLKLLLPYLLKSG